jgi:hypothetical protein
MIGPIVDHTSKFNKRATNRTTSCSAINSPCPVEPLAKDRIGRNGPVAGDGDIRKRSFCSKKRPLCEPAKFAARFFPLPADRKRARCSPELLDSLSLPWLGKSSGELLFSDDLKPDDREQSGKRSVSRTVIIT